MIQKKLTMQLILLCLGLILLGNEARGQWTEPVLLPPPINVNPPGDYYYSTISANGQLLCITINPGIYGDDDVYFSERIDDSSWTVPVNAGPNVNNVQRNLSPSITNDRQRLYYVSYTGSYDIFVSYRMGPDWDDWTQGVPLPVPINRGREFTAQISFDDSTLLFTSTGQPGPLHGEDAMYSSRLQPDNSWSEPFAIAPHLNVLNGAYHPCLTNNGNILVYGMFYPPHFDIWYSFRNDTGFGEGFRCDSTINTRFWDSSPSCPANGLLLYFDSRRNDGPFDSQARLYVANSLPSSVPNRPSRNHLPNIIVSPTFGNGDTEFRISLPDNFAGSSINIFNVMGQLVSRIAANNVHQTQYIWKGVSNDLETLSAGTYFIKAQNAKESVVSRILLLP